MNQIEILQGDALEKLKEIPDESVYCIVTSPPYFGLRDYSVCDCSLLDAPKANCPLCGGLGIIQEVKEKQIGLEETPEQYTQKLVNIFREARRVLKSDGTFWLVIGDSYNGSGGAGGDYNKGGSREGQPKYPGRNISYLKPKDLIGIPWRVAFALQADGWYLRTEIIWDKIATMPESVKDRPLRNHEYIFLFSKSQKYYFDIDSIREPYSEETLKRYKYDMQRLISLTGKDKISKKSNERKKIAPHPLGRLPKTIWHISPEYNYRENHFAVFPEDIPEKCIKAGCPKGEVVLDPFAGSGTTGMVARKLGRKAILIELNPLYIKMIEERTMANVSIDKWMENDYVSTDNGRL